MICRASTISQLLSVNTELRSRGACAPQMQHDDKTMSASAGRPTRSIESMGSVTAWKRAAIPKLILAGCSARASGHPTSDQETFSYDENGLEAAPRGGHSGGSADRSAANARAKIGRVSSNKAAAGSAVCDGDSVSGTAGQQPRPSTSDWRHCCGRSAQALGNRVERIAPLLRSQGFVVDRRHSTFRRIAIVPSLRSLTLVSDATARS